MTWRFFLYNWDGEAVGEIVGATNRQMTFGLNRNPTLSFQLSLKNGLADHLIEFDDHIIVGYRWNPHTSQWACRFSGPIISKEQVAGDDGEGSFAIAAVGAFWRLSKRIANDASGAGKTKGGLKIDTPMEAGQIAALLIRRSNEIDGDNWIRANTEWQAPGTATLNGFEVGSYRAISSVIENLSGGDSAGGFEWIVRPQPVVKDSQGIVLGRFYSGPILGIDRTQSGGTNAAIFEYGCGQNNLKEFSVKSSLEFLLNRVSHLDSNAATEDDYDITRSDAASIARIGVFEDVVSAEIVDTGLRAELCREHISLRKQPRRLIEITPARSDVGTAPVPTIDYDICDRVGIRAFYSDRLWFANFDGSPVAVRVYDISITLDDTGAETTTLGLFLD